MFTFIIGSIAALPYVLIFFGVWILSSLVKPLVLVTVVCVASNPTAALHKLQVFVTSLQYMILCNDKKWKKPKEDPASFFDVDPALVDKKTVIFVRHGESTWNDTFNRGDRKKLSFIFNFVPNLFYAIAAEWYFWVTGKANESWFYDAPLSAKGKDQAYGVQRYLASDLEFMTPQEVLLVKILLGYNNSDDNIQGTPSSQLVSSNLRRAISTMAIGLIDRLSHPALENDTIMILPELQEISRNPDALSITPARGKVVRAFSDPPFLGAVFETHIDTSKHTGNKQVSTNGLLRLEAFCRLCFEDIQRPSVIAAGHSLYFRSFFQTYLPYQTEHIAKKTKLMNGGIVGFTLQRVRTSNGQYRYMIDPTSVVTLHGGF